MWKWFIRSRGMPSSAYVDDAKSFAKALTLSEARCAGDYGNAMRRLSRQLGVRWTLLKNLHYREPKTVDAADFVALGTAYDERKLFNQARTRVEARTPIGKLFTGAADEADRAASSLDRAASSLDRSDSGVVG